MARTEGHRERKRVGKLLFWIFVPVALIFGVSCAATSVN